MEDYFRVNELLVRIKYPLGNKIGESLDATTEGYLG